MPEKEEREAGWVPTGYYDIGSLEVRWVLCAWDNAHSRILPACSARRLERLQIADQTRKSLDWPKVRKFPLLPSEQGIRLEL